jgi:hypothetical protein
MTRDSSTARLAKHAHGNHIRGQKPTIARPGPITHRTILPGQTRCAGCSFQLGRTSNDLATKVWHLSFTRVARYVDQRRVTAAIVQARCDQPMYAKLAHVPECHGRPDRLFWLRHTGLTYNPDSHPWRLVLDAIDRAGLNSVLAAVWATQLDPVGLARPIGYAYATLTPTWVRYASMIQFGVRSASKKPRHVAARRG